MSVDDLKYLLDQYGNAKIDEIYLKINNKIVIGVEAKPHITNLDEGEELKLKRYYSPNGKEFRGFIIEYDGRYLSTDWTWTIAKSHAARITPQMLSKLEKSKTTIGGAIEEIKNDDYIGGIEKLYKIFKVIYGGWKMKRG